MGQFIQSVTSLLESLHYCWLHLPRRKRLSETLNEHHNEVGTAASILHYCSRDQTQWPHFPACLGRALSVHSPDFLCLWGWWEWRCAHLGFAVSHKSFLGLIVLIDSFTESENTFSVQRVSELRGEDSRLCGVECQVSHAPLVGQNKGWIGHLAGGMIAQIIVLWFLREVQSNPVVEMGYTAHTCLS